MSQTLDNFFCTNLLSAHITTLTLSDLEEKYVEVKTNPFPFDVDFHENGNFTVLFFFGSADVNNQRKIYFLCIDFGALF